MGESDVMKKFSQNYANRTLKFPVVRFVGQKIDLLWRPPVYFSNSIKADLQKVTIDNHMLLLKNGDRVTYVARYGNVPHDTVLVMM